MQSFHESPQYLYFFIFSELCKKVGASAFSLSKK